jgi:hypothetical protein
MVQTAPSAIMSNPIRLLTIRITTLKARHMADSSSAPRFFRSATYFIRIVRAG